MPALLRGRSGLTIAEIAKLTGATLTADRPTRRLIVNVAPLDTAGAADIAFLEDERHLGELSSTRAGACLMPGRFAASAPPGLAVLVSEEPYRAFVAVARALFPAVLRGSSLFETSGRAPGVQVHPSARIEAGVTIDPFAVIGPRAEVGAGTLIAAGAAVGPDVCVGRQCAIGAGVTILNALIGDRVVIGPGARIGQEGLGCRPRVHGQPKIPQTRRVIIQDDVEVGANAAIERGSIRDTVIGEGTKVDNLVQVSRNVTIGRHCLIAAQAGIGGGVTLGDFVTIGGQAGIADDIVVGDGAVLASRSLTQSDVQSGAQFGRFPVPPRGGGA